VPEETSPFARRDQGFENGYEKVFDCFVRLPGSSYNCSVSFPAAVPSVMGIKFSKGYKVSPEMIVVSLYAQFDFVLDGRAASPRHG
jgi:hypothetical protein